MKRLFILFACVLMLVAGCGGGGGGVSQVTLTGLVEWIGTGGAPSPVATVQVGTLTTTTGADGSFVLTVPTGTTSALVLFTPTGGSPITTRFDFSGLTGNTDLGTLVIGPESVTVTGLVKSGSTGAPVPNAKVSLGGRTALTDAAGRYTLLKVAYDSAHAGNFLNLEGTVLADKFLSSKFRPTADAISGTANVDDVFLVPVSGDDPPGFPSTIQGSVLPSGQATGTVVKLMQGTTLLRQFTVGSSSNTYRFWIEPGSYTIKVNNPTNGLSDTDFPVTVVSTEDSIVHDINLR